jgi:hypothetical protein
MVQWPPPASADIVRSLSSAEETGMESKRLWTVVLVTALVSALTSSTMSAQAKDKYTVKVPGGLAFSEFRGYESWQLISLSQSGDIVAAILGNPTMIQAYEKGIPANGKPVPDGTKMAKIHWTAKKSEKAPSPTTVPGALHDVDFMAKDSKRFADSGGWGYGAFKYDAASASFTPATTADAPPQANDAKCGFGCHTIVKSRDYVFTEYGSR